MNNVPDPKHRVVHETNNEPSNVGLGSLLEETEYGCVFEYEVVD